MVDPQADLAFPSRRSGSCRDLDGKVPLIGFAGAPLTLSPRGIEE